MTVRSSPVSIPPLLLALTVAGALVGAETPAAVDAAADVEALIAEALAQNAELRLYEQELAAARGERRAEAAPSRPELSVALGGKQVVERGGGPTLGDGLVWSVSVAQAFEFPGRIDLRKAIANGQVQLAELGLEGFRRSLAARTRTLVHRLAGAQELAAATGEVAARYRALLEVRLQRDTAGVTPVLEQRILEASALAQEQRAGEAEIARQQALLELNRLLGRPLAQSLELERLAEKLPEPPPLDTLLAQARTNSFGIRTRQVELEQQGYRVDLRRNERWPSITVEPYYSEERADVAERQFGVGVRVPLPLWRSDRGRTEAARARQQQAEAALRATVLDVEQKVSAAGLGYRAKHASLGRLRPAARERLREAARLADEHYRLGAVPLAIYVEMQSGYLEALEALLAMEQDACGYLEALDVLTGSAAGKERTLVPAR